MGGILANGLMLVVGSTSLGPFRPGGEGRADLWLATRATSSDAWGAIVNLGAVVNSPSYDVSHCVAADGSRLYFASSRPGGFGGFDIWQVEIIALPAGAFEKDANADLDEEPRESDERREVLPE